MAGGLSPIHSFADFNFKFKRLAARGEGRTAEEITEYPFYGVLLYQAAGGLDRCLSAFLAHSTNWSMLDELTGRTWILAALEQPRSGSRIQEFKPNDVYQIATAFSVPKDLLPALVVFTGPLERNQVLRQPLLPVLTEAPDDNAIQRFFQTMTAAMERHVDESPERRLESLQRELQTTWPTTESVGSRLKGAMIVAAPAMNLANTFLELSERIAHMVG